MIMQNDWATPSDPNSMTPQGPNSGPNKSILIVAFSMASILVTAGIGAATFLVVGQSDENWENDQSAPAVFAEQDTSLSHPLNATVTSEDSALSLQVTSASYFRGHDDPPSALRLSEGRAQAWIHVANDSADLEITDLSLRFEVQDAGAELLNSLVHTYLDSSRPVLRPGESRVFPFAQNTSPESASLHVSVDAVES